MDHHFNLSAAASYVVPTCTLISLSVSTAEGAMYFMNTMTEEGGKEKAERKQMTKQESLVIAEFSQRLN